MMARDPLIALQKLRALRVDVIRQSLHEAKRTAGRRAAMAQAVHAQLDEAQRRADTYFATGLSDATGEQAKGALFTSLALGHHAAQSEVDALKQRQARLLAREEEAAAEHAELIEVHHALRRKQDALDELVAQRRRALTARMDAASDTAMQDAFGGRKPNGTS